MKYINCGQPDSLHNKKWTKNTENQKQFKKIVY